MESSSFQLFVSWHNQFSHWISQLEFDYLLLAAKGIRTDTEIFNRFLWYNVASAIIKIFTQCSAETAEKEKIGYSSSWGGGAAAAGGGRAWAKTGDPWAESPKKVCLPGSKVEKHELEQEQSTVKHLLYEMLRYISLMRRQTETGYVPCPRGHHC